MLMLDTTNNYSIICIYQTSFVNCKLVVPPGGLNCTDQVPRNNEETETTAARKGIN